MPEYKLSVALNNKKVRKPRLMEIITFDQFIRVMGIKNTQLEEEALIDYSTQVGVLKRRNSLGLP